MPAANTASPSAAPHQSETSTGAAEAVHGSSASADADRGARIFDLLVENEDDLVGYVAYGLYKKDKFAFMAGRPGCGDRDISVFCDTVRMRTDSYRDEAWEVLQAMQQSLYAEDLATEQRNYEKQLTEQLEKVNSHGYWYHVWQHVIASAAAILLLYVVLILLLAWRDGPTKLWNQYMNGGQRGEAASGTQPAGPLAAPPAAAGTQQNR